MEQEVPELERVKRLIRKLSDRTTDRGCSENEAMESAVKIGALLQQFDLELSDVFIAEEICVQREFYAANAHFQPVVGGISRLCSLKHYRDAGQLGVVFVVFGFQRDLELAEYLYEVIMEAFGTEWAAYSRVNGFARKTRESFEMGFANRVYVRLAKIRKERDEENAKRVRQSDCKDLVLVRDHLVEEEFAKTGIRLFNGGTSRIHDRRAYNSGHEAGGRVNINAPLNGDSRSMIS